MLTNDRVCEKIECVAEELVAYARELRHAPEGGFRWQPATFNAINAIKAALTIEDTPVEREPHTFEEQAAA